MSSRDYLGRTPLHIAAQRNNIYAAQLLLKHNSKVMPRDGARIGTAHVALGRNNDIGGETLSDVHMDALMDKVTVELDGNRVLNNGVLLI